MQITNNNANIFDFNVKTTANSNTNTQNSNNFTLSEDEKRIVSKLAASDAHVRAHEAAHMAAGGSLTTAANYTYEKGPDNKMYAVAGEVGIRTTSGKTPQETIEIARQIRRAALAPSDPSPQDLRVSAKATSMEIMARAQITQQNLEQNSNNSSNNTNSNNNYLQNKAKAAYTQNF